MENIKSGKELIIESLKNKSSLKQDIFDITKDVFSNFKKNLNDIHTELNTEIMGFDDRVGFTVKETGDFEAELKFSGDVLVFTMHTNVFNFDSNHSIYKSDYIKEDPSRSYCGLIQIYNFLADSFKYNRNGDIGYLLARIFINKDKHFFIEGKRQLGFLYNDFANSEMNDVYIKAIIESAIIYAIDFDLLVPPYEAIQSITVQEMRSFKAEAGIRTGKRLGFQFSYDSEV